MASHMSPEFLLDFEERGDLCLMTGDYQNAIEVYNVVLYTRELLPKEDVRRAVFSRGQAYFFEERHESAIRDFDDALSPTYMGPGSSAEVTGLIHIHRAASLRKLGRLTESKESYEKYERLASTRGYPVPKSEGAEIFQGLLEWDGEPAVPMSPAFTDRRPPFRLLTSSSMARDNGSTVMAFDDARVGFFQGLSLIPLEIVIVAPFLKYPSYGQETSKTFKIHLAIRDGIFIRSYLQSIFHRAEKDAVGDSEDVKEFRRMARIHADADKSKSFVVTIMNRALQLPSFALRGNFVASSIWPLRPREVEFTNRNEKVKLSPADKDFAQLENERPVLHVIPEDHVNEWIESLGRAESPNTCSTTDPNSLTAALKAATLGTGSSR